jgi:cytoskeletal protein CcmA (bactofilin family)
MASNHTLITHGTQLKGDITFSGDFTLQGKLVGNIYAEGKKEARLVIGDTGVLEGEIHVPIVIVNGTVIGNIYSSKQLEMAAKGVVKGTVHYHSLQIVNGAQINGSMVSDQSKDTKQLQAEPA